MRNFIVVVVVLVVASAVAWATAARRSEPQSSVTPSAFATEQEWIVTDVVSAIVGITGLTGSPSVTVATAPPSGGPAVWRDGRYREVRARVPERWLGVDFRDNNGSGVHQKG